MAVHATGGVIAAGALLSNRAGRSHIELVSSRLGRLFRLPPSSPFVQARLRDAGALGGDHLGFFELDVLVRYLSDNPEEFSRLASADPKADYLDVMPRAAVLARWGPKGARVVKRL